MKAMIIICFVAMTYNARIPLGDRQNSNLSIGIHWIFPCKHQRFLYLPPCNIPLQYKVSVIFRLTCYWVKLSNIFQLVYFSDKQAMMASTISPSSRLKALSDKAKL